MIAAPNSRTWPWACLGTAALFGAFLFAYLPQGVVALNDDFAYLRSIVETLQRGRIWTDEFLEPWALSLTGAAAALYRLTGSFTFAVQGLQVAAAVASGFFAARFVQHATRSTPLAVGIALAILTFPTALWKQAEFTAMVIYLPALLATIAYAARRAWLGFFIAFAVALGSRQSAIVWLVFPMLEVAGRAVGRKGRPGFASALVVLALGAAWWWGVTRYAHVTTAQRAITDHILGAVTLSLLVSHLLTAFWVMGVGTGIAGLVLWLAGQRLTRQRTRLERGAGVIVGLILLGTLPLVGNASGLSFEHPLFDHGGATPFLRALVALGALGWAVAAPRLEFRFAGAALAAAGLASVKAQLWDYYLIDAVLFAVAGVVAHSGLHDRANATPRWARAAALATLGALVISAVVVTSKTKQAIDERAAAGVVLERALRAGWMRPDELSHAPFGFVGWHLYPYYARHEGKGSGDLAGFGAYIRGSSVDFRIDEVPRHASTADYPPDVAHPFSEVHPAGWFRTARFYLVRRDDPRPAAVAINRAEYVPQPFPLNDAEWRLLIDAKPVR
ncbi:hypothetical protein [Opitutus sp. ER46]|uniref:hypothetical protein n=1 Tax=Opitutus sp. ER46 TaxID=2161864 RepID=UPI000D304FFB|nr:hypothetical protein [Opitutus sp. ER46]PTX97705.1 hypothetical protein DB354_05335 [Opitutus sp. ER46]